MIRVWFNHWFSTSYRLIQLMKEAGVCSESDKSENNSIYVIGSNKKVDSVIQKVCDEWYEEPDLGGEEYIQFCLNFCKEHDVNVFVPRRQMVEISRNKKRFEEAGVKLLVDDYEIMDILNDKAKAYQMFKDDEFVKVPDFYIVNNVEDFKTAYEKLKEKYNKVCMKYVHDEGGMSFRRIVDNVNRFERLSIYPGAEMVYSDLVEILSERETFKDIMVMPFLGGKEISIDCLDTKDGLIAVPRIKGSARHEEVKFDEELLKMAQIIMDKVKLKYPCNIQFKIMDGIPYFLEINTRMSGGLQMSCEAADINIPGIALNKLLGYDMPWTLEKKDRVVSYIELPQVIR